MNPLASALTLGTDRVILLFDIREWDGSDTALDLYFTEVNVTVADSP